MKFSHSLQFNGAPEWSGQYINYKALKKYILKIEQLQAQLATLSSSRVTLTDESLDRERDKQALEQQVSALKESFGDALQKELRRVENFYNTTENKLTVACDDLKQHVMNIEGALTSQRDTLSEDRIGGLGRRRRQCSNVSAVSSDRGETDALLPRGRSTSILSTFQDWWQGLGHKADEVASVPHSAGRHLSLHLDIPSNDAGDHRGNHMETRSVRSASGEDPSNQSLLGNASHANVRAERDAIRSEACLLFVQLHNLQEYIDLNHTGFQKILKKYDKRANTPISTSSLFYSGFHTIPARISETSLDQSTDAQAFFPAMETDTSTATTPLLLGQDSGDSSSVPIAPTSLTSVYMPKIDALFEVLRSSAQAKLQPAMLMVRDLYAYVCWNGDLSAANTDLRRHLRDRIVWDRNTIWRDMMDLERRSTGAHALSAEPLAWTTEEVGDQAADVIAKRKSFWRQWRQLILLSLCIVVFISLLVMPEELFDSSDHMALLKQRCMAVFVFVSMLWALEVFPLFVTSLILPFLVVTLGILNDPDHPGQPLPAKAAAKVVFHAMFSQVICLLLGGFAIAAAMTKHDVAKMTAVALLKRSGTHPNTVLFVNMCVATFASMWISNVAAPVLCYGIMMPVLRAFPAGHPFASAMVIGIALASNIGGMASPIASPQNIFALEHLANVGWLKWFSLSLPVCISCLLLCWLVLVVVYKPQETIVAVPAIRYSPKAWSWHQLFVIFVSAGTIALWCANSALQSYTGEMGILALIPLILFFGFGILTKEDLNAFLWNVVILAMGGLVLGESVKSSGLLRSVAEGIQAAVGGFSVWIVLCIFGALMLVFATMISHTVSAMVILPIIQRVGGEIFFANDGTSVGNYADILVMGAVLICSGAMGLPVSGFPNMTACALEDATGKSYVTTLDFVKTGIPSSILAYLAIVTIGYGCMLLFGF